MKIADLLPFPSLARIPIDLPKCLIVEKRAHGLFFHSGSGIVPRRALWKSNSVFISLINYLFRKTLRIHSSTPNKTFTPKFQSGNQVKLFFKGEEAFAAIRSAMENASSEILLETYILRDDATGLSLLKLLGEAAKRGVQIKVLADAYGSWGTHKTFWTKMQELGIENRLFHPFGSHLRGLFIRDHRKIIVIDQQITFVGGMNIANEYGSSRNRKNRTWRDSHAMIVGPTAREFVKIFSQNWERAGGSATPFFPAKIESTVGVQALVLNSSFKDGNDQSALAFSTCVSGSRKRLWITNSYFAPNETVITLLKNAAKRGVDVRLLLQGQTDMPLLRLAARGSYADLLSNGIRIFEYQSAILHAKTILIDDHISIVGSSNLDYRSIYFNSECNLLMHDENVATVMTKTFLEDLEQSVEIHDISWKQRSLLQKLKQQIACFMSPFL